MRAVWVFLHEHDAAVQAGAALVSALVTIALLWITSRYAKSTKRLAESTDGLARSTAELAKYTAAQSEASRVMAAATIKQKRIQVAERYDAELRSVIAAAQTLRKRIKQTADKSVNDQRPWLASHLEQFALAIERQLNTLPPPLYARANDIRNAARNLAGTVRDGTVTLEDALAEAQGLSNISTDAEAILRTEVDEL